MSYQNLAGKKVLVTAAGDGLGKAIADELSRCGAIVYGTSRREPVRRRIEERYGTVSLPVDLTNGDSIREFSRGLLESNGIDLLVNNAGANVPQPALKVTESDWDTVFDVNLKGTFFLTQAIAKHWIRQGVSGAVVNVSSQAGIVGIEERAAYGSSKAGLIHLTKILALEWASAGIRVNAVAPTFVRTELTESTLSRPDWAAELKSRIPAGRFGEPEDVAGGVSFLLSDAADLITGHTLSIDGGYTIR